MTIKIKRFNALPAAFLYGPEGEYVDCIVNEMQLHDVRLQIQKEFVDGYYLKWTNPDTYEVITIPINRYGAIVNWPEGFYDQIGKQSEEILRGAMNRRKAERIEADVDRQPKN